MVFKTHREQQHYDLSKFTILLVEDSVYMQTLMSSMLKTFGVGDIVVCDGAEDAINLLTIMQARKQSRHVNRVDIVLTDWLMPEGSGHELLQWIRGNENDAISFLPVVVVSGYATERLAGLTRDMGANETLVKPISGKTLASRICTVIDHPRPFIRTPDYFGPDRRRQELPFEGQNRRSSSPNVVEVK